MKKWFPFAAIGAVGLGAILLTRKSASASQGPQYAPPPPMPPLPDPNLSSPGIVAPMPQGPVAVRVPEPSAEVMNQAYAEASANAVQNSEAYARAIALNGHLEPILKQYGATTAARSKVNPNIVMGFQLTQPFLVADGKYGPKTQAALAKVLGIPAPPALY